MVDIEFGSGGEPIEMSIFRQEYDTAMQRPRATLTFRSIFDIAIFR